VLACAGDHVNVYGAVPPVAVEVAVPLHVPKHVALVCVPDSVNPPPALATTTVAVYVLQPEVAVTVYVPAHNPVAVAPVPPEGDQEYV
jgi:hypothetical protein